MEGLQVCFLRARGPLGRVEFVWYSLMITLSFLALFIFLFFFCLTSSYLLFILILTLSSLLFQPAIAWWPGVIPPSTLSRQLFSTMDLFPTMYILLLHIVNFYLYIINIIIILTNCKVKYCRHTTSKGSIIGRNGCNRCIIGFWGQSSWLSLFLEWQNR